MKRTANYALPDWEKSDFIKMDDFNDAFGTLDVAYNTYHSISDLPAHIIEEMRHFFKVYGALQNKTVNVNKATGPDAAKQIIAEAIDRYQQKYGSR